MVKGKTPTAELIGKIIMYVLLILMAAIMLIPFIWMISSSLKLEKDVFSFPIQWIPADPQLSLIHISEPTRPY